MRTRWAAGEQFPSALAKGVADCRALLVAVSKDSLNSNWWYNRIMAWRNGDVPPEFPVIPVAWNRGLPPQLFLPRR